MRKFTNELQPSVNKAKKMPEWEDQYMFLSASILDDITAGIEAGKTVF